MSENGEIYTAGKNFTLPQARLAAWTNSTSASIGEELQMIIMTDVGSKECKITKKYLYFPLLFFTISSAIGAEKSDRAKFFSLAFSPIAVAQSILLFTKAVTPVLSISEIKFFLVPL